MNENERTNYWYWLTTAGLVLSLNARQVTACVRCAVGCDHRTRKTSQVGARARYSEYYQLLINQMTFSPTRPWGQGSRQNETNFGNRVTGSAGPLTSHTQHWQMGRTDTRQDREMPKSSPAPATSTPCSTAPTKSASTATTTSTTPGRPPCTPSHGRTRCSRSKYQDFLRLQASKIGADGPDR